MKKSFVNRALSMLAATSMLLSVFTLPAHAERVAPPPTGDPVYDSMTQKSESMSEFMIEHDRTFGKVIGDTSSPRSVGLLAMGALYITKDQPLPEKFDVYLGRITLFAYSKSQKKWVVLDDQPAPKGIYLYPQPWTNNAKKCNNVTYNENGTAKVTLTAEEMNGYCLHFWGKTQPFDRNEYLYYASAYDFWVSAPAVGKLTASAGIDTKDSTNKNTVSQLYSSRGLSSSTQKKTLWGHTIPLDEYNNCNGKSLNQLFKGTVYVDPNPVVKPTPTPAVKPTPTPANEPTPTPPASENAASVEAGNTEEKPAVKSTKISKVTAKKNSITVKWKKRTSKVDGYQLQYSTNKDFKKKVKKINVKGSKKNTFEISKLNYGSKYYVRIRTYKKIDGRKTYSDWSKTKSVSIPYAKNRFGFKK